MRPGYIALRRIVTAAAARASEHGGGPGGRSMMDKIEFYSNVAVLALMVGTLARVIAIGC